MSLGRQFDAICVISAPLSQGEFDKSTFLQKSQSYNEGYRTFEVDIMMSSDGIPILTHDGQEKKYYGLNGIFSDFTADEFLSTKLYSEGTTIAGPQLLELIKDYPDIRIFLDNKIADQASAIIWFLDRLPPQEWPRLLTSIRSGQNIKALYA